MDPQQDQPASSQQSSKAVRDPKPWKQYKTPAANPVDPHRPWECTWDMGTDPHTGRPNRPCNGTYAHQHALQAHVREVHCRNTEIQCDLCSCWLKGPGYLTKHRAGRACVREQAKLLERRQAGNDDPVGFRRRLNARNIPGGKAIYLTYRRKTTEVAGQETFKLAAPAPADFSQQFQGFAVPASAPAPVSAPTPTLTPTPAATPPPSLWYTGFPATPQLSLNISCPTNPLPQNSHVQLAYATAHSFPGVSTPTTIDPNACMECYPKACMCVHAGFSAKSTQSPMLSAGSTYSSLRNPPNQPTYSTDQRLPSLSTRTVISSNACIRCYPFACICPSTTSGRAGSRGLGAYGKSSNAQHMPGNSGHTAASSNGIGENRYTMTANSGTGYTVTDSNGTKYSGDSAWLDPALRNT